MKNNSPDDGMFLTDEATLCLAVSVLQKEEREYLNAHDIHSIIETNIEEQPLRLPVDAKDFETMLEKSEKFVSLGHGFFSLEGVEVNMELFKRLIAMGMYG